MTSPFDLDAKTRLAWAQAAAAFASEFLDATDKPPKRKPESEFADAAFGETPLAGGIEQAIALIAERAEAGFNPTGTGYLGFIPGGGLYATAVADFLSDVLNRYTGLNEPSAALVKLEKDLIQWLATEFGYAPGAAGGMLTSGSSLANFAAVVAARDRKCDGDFRAAVGYASNQVHHSVDEAFRLAGIPEANLRRVGVDARFRLDLADLRARLKRDRAEGRTPIMVVASAGTTNTGAIDPLEAVADLCAEHGAWFHVDAAYGGGFMLVPEARARFKGIERADSIAFDPHKGMFLPYGTGCLLFKNEHATRQAAHANRGYLQGYTNIAPHPFSLELTRPFRGLRVWLPLMLHGAAAFREALREKLALAGTLYDGLQRAAAKGLPLDVLGEPQVSVVAFRLKRLPGEAIEAWNRRNEAFNKAVNAGNLTFVSSATLPYEDQHVLTLRACILSHRTRAEHVERCLHDIEAAAGQFQ